SGELSSRIGGGGLSDDELRSDVQRGVRRRDLDRKLRQGPMAIRTTVAAEHLPQRRQVDGVDYQETVGLHPYEAFGRGADADALPLGQGQHAAGLIRVDDLRAAVAHLPATLEPLGHDLDAPDIAARVEDLTRGDDRVRHRLRSDMWPPSGAAMHSTASSSPP